MSERGRFPREQSLARGKLRLKLCVILKIAARSVGGFPIGRRGDGA